MLYALQHMLGGVHSEEGYTQRRGTLRGGSTCMHCLLLPAKEYDDASRANVAVLPLSCVFAGRCNSACMCGLLWPPLLTCVEAHLQQPYPGTCQLLPLSMVHLSHVVHLHEGGGSPAGGQHEGGEPCSGAAAGYRTQKRKASTKACASCFTIGLMA